MQRHITFQVQDCSPAGQFEPEAVGLERAESSETSLLKKKMKGSGSGSIFNLTHGQTARCRRIYASFALPFPISADDCIARKPPALLDHILSQDFEDFAIEKLGTRRLFVNIGPFHLPEDVDADFELRSSTSTSFSSSSALSLEDKPTANQDLFCVPGGFVRACDEDCDELLRKSHVEIAVGKGGVFTRSTFRCKQLNAVKDVDLGRSDIAIFVYTFTEQDETRASFDVPAVSVNWRASDGITIKDFCTCSLSSPMIFLLEVMFRSKNVIVMIDCVAECIHPLYVTLFAILRRSRFVRFCDNAKRLEETLQDLLENYVVKGANDEYPDELLSRNVTCDEDAVDWIEHHIATESRS